MKQINTILTFAVATLFVACGKPSQKESLEEKAMERARLYTEAAIGDRAKTLEITDFETIFSDDSVCIIQYDAKAESYSGETATLNMEYYILWTISKERKLVENFYILDGKKSLMDRTISFFEGDFPKDDSIRSIRLRICGSALDAFSLKDATKEVSSLVEAAKRKISN